MRRKLACCAVLTLVGAAATTILAAPASASTATPLPLRVGPTVTHEVETTTYDSVDPGRSKEVTASCQDGTKLIGVGYSRSGGASGVVIHQAVPHVNGLDNDHVTVTAYETAAGTPNPWSLSARAICASGLSNVEVVYRSTHYDTQNPKDIVAPCTFPKKVVGTSFVAFGGQGEVMVTEVNPIAVSGGNDFVRVTAHADDDGITANGNWGVTAYAFCATAPFGLTIMSHSEDLPTGDDDIDDAVSCPDGKVSLGGGVYLNGDSAGNLMLTHLFVGGPISTGDYLASAGAREDADGTPADWELTVKVVCATG